MLYFSVMLLSYNVALDYITTIMVVWNFSVMGMISIHWKAPLVLQQAFLIIVSALTALIFIRFLPDWTTWTVLGAIAIWGMSITVCILAVGWQRKEEGGEGLEKRGAKGEKRGDNMCMC